MALLEQVNGTSSYTLSRSSTGMSYPFTPNTGSGNWCIPVDADKLVYFLSCPIVDGNRINFLLDQRVGVPLDLPYYLEDALDALVSFYLLQTLPSSAEFTNGASRMYQQYKGVLAEVKERMLVRSDSEESFNMQRDAGWR